MITVILNNYVLEFVTRRYHTNSFDEALKLLVDDWADGKIVWETEETVSAFTPQFMKKHGYANPDFEPDIDRENEVFRVRWFWGGEDEFIVDGQLFKTVPVQEHEWPTMGVA